MSDALVPAGAPAPFLRSPIPRALAARPTEARWRPGLSQQPLHSEIFASGDEASGAGLALALARDALAAAGGSEDARQVLWVQDRGAIRHGGRPCVAGLPPDLRHRLIHVAAPTPEDALFALEDYLRFAVILACAHRRDRSANRQALPSTAFAPPSGHSRLERQRVRFVVGADRCRNPTCLRRGLRWRACSCRPLVPTPCSTKFMLRNHVARAAS